MALEKETVTAQIEVVGKYKVIQVAKDTVVKEDGKEISKSRHRTSFMPDQDVSDQDNEIKDIANVVWTDAVKTAWNDEKTKRENS